MCPLPILIRTTCFSVIFNCVVNILLTHTHRDYPLFGHFQFRSEYAPRPYSKGLSIPCIMVFLLICPIYAIQYSRDFRLIRPCIMVFLLLFLIYTIQDPLDHRLIRPCIMAFLLLCLLYAIHYHLDHRLIRPCIMAFFLLCLLFLNIVNPRNHMLHKHYVISMLPFIP